MNRNKFLSKSATVFFTIAILSLLGFYLYQTGRVIQLSYLSSFCKRQIEKAGEENGLLRAQFMDKLSLNSIEEKVKILSFVPVKDVKFIELGEMYITNNLARAGQSLSPNR